MRFLVRIDPNRSVTLKKKDENSKNAQRTIRVWNESPIHQKPQTNQTNHCDPKKNGIWGGRNKNGNSPNQNSLQTLRFPSGHNVFFWKKFYTSNQNFKRPPIGPPRCQEKNWPESLPKKHPRPASPHNAIPHTWLSTIKGGREPPRDLRRAYSDWILCLKKKCKISSPFRKKTPQFSFNFVSSASPPYSPIRIYELRKF